MTNRSQHVKFTINDRTEEPILRRLYHPLHIAGISREVSNALHPTDELLQSIAFVSVGEPPPCRSSINYSFATVVALATRCRALGDKPWTRSSHRAYKDREHAPVFCLHVCVQKIEDHHPPIRQKIWTFWTLFSDV